MWDLFGFPGEIGHGYTVTQFDDEIGVRGPPGSDGTSIIVRESSVFVCTLDDNFLFIASRYGEKSSNAKIWRVDLAKGRTHEYVLPNDVPTIMSHIHGYSPGVRNQQIGLLTGEGQAITVVVQVFSVSLLGSIGLAGLVLLVLHLRKRRKKRHHGIQSAAAPQA